MLSEQRARRLIALAVTVMLAACGTAASPSSGPESGAATPSPINSATPKTLLPDGTWQVELSSSELAAAGAPEYAPGTYAWTFDGTHAHITAPAPWGGLIECDAEASPVWDGVVLTYGQDSGCGAGKDRIQWTLDDAGLHFTLLETTGDFKENRAYLEAKPWQLASSTPSGSPSSNQSGITLPGYVLFDHTEGEDVHTIYLLSAGKSQPLVSPGAFGLGRLSPDHKRFLAITDAGKSGTLDFHGADFRPIPSPNPTMTMLPSCWSPNGSRIAFLAWDDADASRMGIYTARASDGGDLVRVTTRPGQLADVPMDYSPDGRWILFYRSAHPDPDPHVGGSLWVVHPDGSGARNVNGEAHPADWARWSPDGRKIVFATERTAPKGAIWTVSPDGSHLTRLFSDPEGGFPVSPAWSPDGSQILFALDPTNDEFEHEPNVFAVIDADGTHLQKVAGTFGFNRWPEWWE